VYAAIDDQYCYKGTTILKNRLGLRVQADLDAFEADATAQRFAEPLPQGRFTVTHYQAVHRHIFGDVYPWAGRFRTVRIAKEESMFAYPEYIGQEMRRVFAELREQDLLRDTSAREFGKGAAHFLAELNAIHPFRDGNGRTQLTFVSLLAFEAGHPIAFERIKPRPFLKAMIESFSGREKSLEKAL
jgi:cell filamentation protein